MPFVEVLKLPPETLLSTICSGWCGHCDNHVQGSIGSATSPSVPSHLNPFHELFRLTWLTGSSRIPFICASCSLLLFFSMHFSSIRCVSSRLLTHFRPSTAWGSGQPFWVAPPPSRGLAHEPTLRLTTRAAQQVWRLAQRPTALTSLDSLRGPLPDVKQPSADDPYNDLSGDPTDPVDSPASYGMPYLRAPRGAFQSLGLTTRALRVQIDSGGCSGIAYRFLVETRAHPGDWIFHVPTVSDAADRTSPRVPRAAEACVLIDGASMTYLDGSTLDYTSNLARHGFEVIKNPNAAATCGCATSFMPQGFEPPGKNNPPSMS